MWWNGNLSRWLESAAAGRSLETEAARARVAELWALEQELADEAAILQGLRTDKDAIESLLTGNYFHASFFCPGRFCSNQNVFFIKAFACFADADYVR